MRNLELLPQWYVIIAVEKVATHVTAGTADTGTDKKVGALAHSTSSQAKKITDVSGHLELAAGMSVSKKHDRINTFRKCSSEHLETELYTLTGVSVVRWVIAPRQWSALLLGCALTQSIRWWTTTHVGVHACANMKLRTAEASLLNRFGD